MNKIFSLVLHKSYYNKGFFNALKAFDEHIGEHGDTVEINIPDCQQVIKGKINRKQNINRTARIYNGQELRTCFQENFEINREVDLFIYSPTRLEIRKKA